MSFMSQKSTIRIRGLLQVVVAAEQVPAYAYYYLLPTNHQISIYIFVF